MFFHRQSRLLHRFVDGVVMHRTARGMRIEAPAGVLEVDVEPPLVEALSLLSGAGAEWRQVSAVVLAGGPPMFEALDMHIDELARLGLVEIVFHAAGSLHARITAMVPGFRFTQGPMNLDAPLMLSRFAYVRRDGAATVVESPQSQCRVELTTMQAWTWLGKLSEPVAVADLVAADQGCLADFAQLLWRAGFVDRIDVPEEPARASWEFHDLMFHWRTRGGRVNAPQGGSFRFAGAFDAPPAIKSAMSAERIGLPRPPEADAGIAAVAEQRRSVREQSDEPIAVADLAKLLFHTVRVKERLAGDQQQLLLKPVPGAGAIHEIEVYLAVNACEGLAPGLYHYESDRHALARVPGDPTYVAALLAEAAETWGQPGVPPQVLVILASRVPRIAWKYEGIAYRLSLLNAGVIIESIYLLATEMGLACSALGGGDSMMFAAATGLDPLEETSIAEIALGRRQAQPKP